MRLGFHPSPLGPLQLPTPLPLKEDEVAVVLLRYEVYRTGKPLVLAEDGPLRSERGDTWLS